MTRSSADESTPNGAGTNASLEGALQECEQKFRDILEASSDGIFVLVDGVIRFVNPAFRELVGVASEASLDGRALAEFVAQPERAALVEALTRSEKSSGRREVFDLTVTREGGEGLRLEVSCRASTLGGRRAVVGVARDVTHVRELQDELARSRTRAAHVERLRALGELAAGVAHDFNNVLETILGRVALAKERAAKGEDLTKDLEVIERVAGDAGHTIHRIREFSRPSGGDAWHDVDLAAIVRDVGEYMRTRVPKGVAFVVNPGTTPKVRGNAAELREALSNLVSNAFDAVTTGGTVRLSSGLKEGFCVVLIEDDGAGMEKEVLNHLFEPFFSTKGDRGTGLGLSVSHGILRRHDANLEVDSAPGRGTRFRISFAPTGRMLEPHRRVAPPQMQVLVVDDDANVAELLKDLLEEHGHTITTATDMEQAVALLSSQPFHLLITDLDLPGASGWQLARRAREVAPNILVGLITGWPLAAPEAELARRGVDFVLAKPFSMDALLKALGQLH